MSFLIFQSRFQSTHPLRDATLVRKNNDKRRMISIHAPLTGCDQLVTVLDVLPISISIHAPLTGCDAT